MTAHIMAANGHHRSESLTRQGSSGRELLIRRYHINSSQPHLKRAADPQSSGARPFDSSGKLEPGNRICRRLQIYLPDSENAHNIVARGEISVNQRYFALAGGALRAFLY